MFDLLSLEFLFILVDQLLTALAGLKSIFD